MKYALSDPFFQNTGRYLGFNPKPISTTLLPPPPDVTTISIGIAVGGETKGNNINGETEGIVQQNNNFVNTNMYSPPVVVSGKNAEEKQLFLESKL